MGVAFTDGRSGVVLGSFDGTSDTGFGATYGASQQLADTYTAPSVIPLTKWNTFHFPGFDNTSTYYGFISQMVTNTLIGFFKQVAPLIPSATVRPMPSRWLTRFVPFAFRSSLLPRA